MVPVDHYFSADVFAAEMKGLFRANFQFVGMTSELARDRDFVCLDYADTAIVVQNFKGELRAFLNVCSHRFSRIQREERGNRPLTCRYHGWTYNEEGFPSGMPKRAEYIRDSGDAERACLVRFRVETCGKFVFVCEEDNGKSLKDHLGKYYDVIAEMSTHIGDEIYYGTVPHKANWKVLVENVVDNHHCMVLHQDTFLSWGFCRLPPEDVAFDGPHSSFHVPRAEVEREGLRKRAFSHLDGRGLAHNSFFHILVFPNLFIASNEGMSFYVGHALPVSPDETILKVRYFEPDMAFTGGHRVRQDLVNEATRANALKIVEEDRPILEDVQIGVRNARKAGMVAETEPRLKAFLDQYERAINLARQQEQGAGPVEISVEQS